MPTYKITAPDGRTFRVQAPEGATREQALARVQQQYSQQQSQQTPVKPQTPAQPQQAPSTFDRGLQIAERLPYIRDKVAQAETVASFGSGMLAAPAAGIAGLLTMPGEGYFDRAADKVGRIQNMLTYQPRTERGRETTDLASKPFNMLAQGADYLGGKTTDITGSPALGAAVNTAIQMAPAAILPGGIRRAGRSPSIPASRPGVHPAIAQAESAGFVLDPTQVVGGKKVGSTGKQFAARLGGKADLPAEASLKNQARVNELVAEELGLKKTETITPATVERLRGEANKKYDALQKVDVKLDPDVDFFYGIHQIRQSSRSMMKGGGPDPAINRLLKQYQSSRGGKVPIVDAMEEVKRLRFDARKNQNAEKPGTVRLGQAQRQIADLIEDMIDRQVSPIDPKAAGEWRAARKQLAKLHNVEDALKGTEIDPGALAKALDRGEPLSGNLKTVAEIARNFPHVMQAGSRIGSKAGFGLLDVAMTVPTSGLWPLARIAGKTYALRKSGPPPRGVATATAAGAQSTRGGGR